MVNLDFPAQQQGVLAPGTGLSDLATNGKNLNTNISLLITTLQGIFPRVSGTFTCANAATTTVTETSTTAASVITITPTNAAAGTLQAGATHLYLSARTVGASFAFTTANAAAAAGTETFSYVLWNPV